MQPNITNFWYTFVLSQNVLSRGGYTFYMLPLQLWKWWQIQCMREGTLWLWYISIHARVLTIIPREFQHWIQYYIWVGGYGYKDCSGWLVCRFDPDSQHMLQVAAETQRIKVLESGQNKKNRSYQEPRCTHHSMLFNHCCRGKADLTFTK